MKTPFAWLRRAVAALDGEKEQDSRVSRVVKRHRATRVVSAPPMSPAPALSLLDHHRACGVQPLYDISVYVSPLQEEAP